MGGGGGGSLNTDDQLDRSSHTFVEIKYSIRSTEEAMSTNTRPAIRASQFE